MKIFDCSNCGSLLFYENVTCLNCSRTLGYLPSLEQICAVEEAENGLWRANNPTLEGQRFKLCANRTDHQVCNWLVPAEHPGELCEACELNDFIPDLSMAGNLERWHKLEEAKRRVLYTVFKLHLPIHGAPNRPGLQFNFVGIMPGEKPPATGHLDGVITVNIMEADDAERERRRVSLHEPYRTLLGHLRHEIGHFFWDRLIMDSKWIESFRQNFGDERTDYAQALAQHYNQGPPADWQKRFVSAYASSHPWEDWAESWAHYFHIVDLIETAGSFGVTLNPSHAAAESMKANPANADDSDFDAILNNWFPLTYMLNSLNRGMGQPDGYPFALSDTAIAKIRFIHEVIHASKEPTHSDLAPQTQTA